MVENFLYYWALPSRLEFLMKCKKQKIKKGHFFQSIEIVSCIRVEIMVKIFLKSWLKKNNKFGKGVLENHLTIYFHSQICNFSRISQRTLDNEKFNDNPFFSFNRQSMQLMWHWRNELLEFSFEARFTRPCYSIKYATFPTYTRKKRATNLQLPALV